MNHGGLTAERQILREKLRMEAAERFAQGVENTVIAHDLRVSVRSVQRCFARRDRRTGQGHRPRRGRSRSRS